MSFWDAEKMEEDRRRREEDDRRRRDEYDRLAKKRRQAEELRAKQVAIKKKLKKEADEAEKLESAESALIEEPVLEEAAPWIPPKLNRGFISAPGSPTLTQEAHLQIKKNETERQKNALEESQKSAGRDDQYTGPKLIRPF